MAPLFDDAKSFAFKWEMPVDDFEMMPDIIRKSDPQGGVYSNKVRLVSMLMFWKVPATLIEHFLDQMPLNYRLEFKLGQEMLPSTKYPITFCKKLLQCRGEMRSDKPVLFGV